MKNIPRAIFLVKNDLMENFSSIEAKIPAIIIIEVKKTLLTDNFSPKNKYPNKTIITTRRLKSGESIEISRFFRTDKYNLFPKDKNNEAKIIYHQFVGIVAPLSKEIEPLTIPLNNIIKNENWETLSILYFPISLAVMAYKP